MSTYLSCGNIMSDIIVQPSGEKSTRHMCGPAFFALSGIRLWEDDCALVTHTGADWSEDYEKWLDAHHLSKAGVRVDAEHVTCYQITYDENGRGVPDPQKSFSFYGDEAMGYLKTHPSDIKKNLTPGVKGLYMAQGADRVVWRQLAALKEEFHFKMMWELEYFNTGKDLNRVLEALPLADAWSLNHTEASGLFGHPHRRRRKNASPAAGAAGPLHVLPGGQARRFPRQQGRGMVLRIHRYRPLCGPDRLRQQLHRGDDVRALFRTHPAGGAGHGESRLRLQLPAIRPLSPVHRRGAAAGLGLRGEYLKKVKQVL